ncbi:hypothetical protein RKD21_005708 [Streptomyces albogriseolus]|uniref:Uncharacterized protein n=1 Tax=Streptomyces albogriseolus TaxID=1887 RepID=A0ACC6UVN1_STRAO
MIRRFMRVLMDRTGAGTPDAALRGLTEGDKPRARFLSLHLHSYP